MAPLPDTASPIPATVAHPLADALAALPLTDAGLRALAQHLQVLAPAGERAALALAVAEGVLASRATPALLATVTACWPEALPALRAVPGWAPPPPPRVRRQLPEGWPLALLAPLPLLLLLLSPAGAPGPGIGDPTAFSRGESAEAGAATPRTVVLRAAPRGGAKATALLPAPGDAPRVGRPARAGQASPTPPRPVLAPGQIAGVVVQGGGQLGVDPLHSGGGAALGDGDPLVVVDVRPAQTRRDRGADEAAAGQGSGGSGTRGTGDGSVRHVALADVAPMPFLGVSLADADLWVAGTEVTEAQWAALMGLDLRVLTGRPERPAEHLTFCDAVAYANRLSQSEGLRPAYAADGCTRDEPVAVLARADGYRLLTEAEWESLAEPGHATGLVRRASAWSGSSDQNGLVGVVGNAAEFVWIAETGPAVARHAACDGDESVVQPAEGWPESEPLPCRMEAPRTDRMLGVGLRLARLAPHERGALFSRLRTEQERAESDRDREQAERRSGDMPTVRGDGVPAAQR